MLLARYKTKVIKILNTLSEHPGKVFAGLAGLFGLLLIIVMPPFSGADEEAHFVRAYGITQGNIVIEKNENILMPTAYRNTLGCLQDKQSVAGDTYTYRYNQYGKDLATTHSCMSGLSMNSTLEEVATTAGNYSPFTYVPQMIAIFIGRLFDLSVATTSYLVRISVLLSYIALVCLAIRIMPYRKWALVGVSLLPHALQQVTNPGGDYILIGATAMFIASILKSRELREPLGDRKVLFAATVAAGALMIVPKGMFPGICFLPLLFFFGGLRSFIRLKITALIGVLSFGVLWQRFAYVGGASSATESGSLIESFPFAFIKSMFYSWSNTDFIYVKPGLGLDGDVGMPAIIITLMNIVFGFYLLVAYEKRRIAKTCSQRDSLLLRLMSYTAAAAVIVGSFAGLYIAGAYLQKGDMIIYGVQARYFYPAFILLILLPVSWRLMTTKVVYSTVVMLASVVILSAQLLVVAIRHNWIG